MTTVESRALVSDPATKAILEFSRMRPGWFYGSGAAFGIEVIVSALKAKTILKDLGCEAYEAFPRQDGAIVVAGYRDEYTVNVTCYSRRSFDLLIEREDDEIVDVEGVSLGDISSYVKGLGWKASERYGYFTLNTIHGKNDALIVSRQVSRPMVSQSSTRSVHAGAAERNVVISRYTTQAGYRGPHLVSLAS
jgi:hypothetical protein